jgi:hypothetical protein
METNENVEETKVFEFVPFKFVSYSELENTYRTRELDRTVEQGNATGRWRLSEKVHGCLTWNSVVETKECGFLPIGKIIDEKIKCLIKSYNIDTGEIEWKRVINFSVQEDIGNWYEIETACGKKIQITGNHYVWLPELNCWRQVQDLTENDYVLID